MTSLLIQLRSKLNPNQIFDPVQVNHNLTDKNIKELLDLLLKIKNNYKLYINGNEFTNDIKYMINQLDLTTEEILIIDYIIIEEEKKIEVEYQISALKKHRVGNYWVLFLSGFDGTIEIYQIDSNWNQLKINTFQIDSNIKDLHPIGNMLYTLGLENDIWEIKCDKIDKPYACVKKLISEKIDIEEFRPIENYIIYGSSDGKVIKYDRDSTQRLHKSGINITSICHFFDNICVGSLNSDLYFIKNEIKTLKIGYPVTAIGIFNDTLIIGGSNSVVSIVNKNYEIIKTFQIGIRYVEYIETDGEHIAFAGQNKVEIWNKEKLVKKIEAEDYVRGIVIIENYIFMATNNLLKTFIINDFI
ncbi:hypothetical protein TCON_0360 [Astathelohania contejeani]|uniref:Uncharacterized protein n=1 Tax=Astathelohania contejeani TaxID=164912 RepID=A0ABQ7I246_9MICR|nr:hypothetical protein TCON_0360 [Thelohania contejeani]